MNDHWTVTDADVEAACAANYAHRYDPDTKSRSKDWPTADVSFNAAERERMRGALQSFLARKLAWMPLESAPVSGSMEQEYFFAHCPNDNWGAMGCIHVACRYAGHAVGEVRPVGTNGPRIATGWMPLLLPPTGETK